MKDAEAIISKALLLLMSLISLVHAFSIREAPTLTKPAKFVEHGGPVLICPKCKIDGLSPVEYFDLQFATQSVVIVITTGHNPNADILGGDFPVTYFDYNSATGTLTLEWSNASQRRSAQALERVLRTLTFRSASPDPTQKGTSFTRELTISIVSHDNSLSLSHTIHVQIEGRNDSPVLTSHHPDFTQLPPIPLPYSAGSPTTGFLFPLGTVDFTDPDDTLATRLQVRVLHPVPATLPALQQSVLHTLHADPNTPEAVLNDRVQKVKEGLSRTRSHPEDRLAYTPDGAFSGGAGAGLVATWSNEDQTLEIALSGGSAVPLTVLREALSFVEFYTSSLANPGVRVLEVLVWDLGASHGTGAYALPRVTLTPVYAWIAVDVVNMPPTVDVPHAVSAAPPTLDPLVYYAGTEPFLLFSAPGTPSPPSPGTGAGAPPYRSFGGLGTPSISDPDDANLSGAMVACDTVPSGHWDPRNDVLTVVGTSSASDPIQWVYDASARTLTLSGSQPIDTYIQYLRRVAYAHTDSTPISASLRSCTLTLVDDSRDRAFPPSDRQNSAPVSFVIALRTAVRDPTLSEAVAPIYTFLDTPAGTPLVHGQLVLGSGGDPLFDPHYAVIGGSASAWLDIDAATGRIVIGAAGIPSASTDAGVYTLQVRGFNRDPMDPDVKTVERTFVVTFMDPLLQPTPIDPALVTFPALQLSHGKPLQYCFHVHTLYGYTPPGGGPLEPFAPGALTVEAYWDPKDPRVTGVAYDPNSPLAPHEATIQSDLDARTTAVDPSAQPAEVPLPVTPVNDPVLPLSHPVLRSLFHPDHPLTLRAQDALLGGLPGVYCLSGLPNYGPQAELRTPNALVSPPPVELHLALYIYPTAALATLKQNGSVAGAASATGNTVKAPHDPLPGSVVLEHGHVAAKVHLVPPELVTSASLKFSVTIPGCNNVRARYYPCYKNGVQVPDDEARALLYQWNRYQDDFTPSTTPGTAPAATEDDLRATVWLPFAEPPCDNLCVPITIGPGGGERVVGECANACIPSADGTGCVNPVLYAPGHVYEDPSILNVAANPFGNFNPFASGAPPTSLTGVHPDPAQVPPSDRSEGCEFPPQSILAHAVYPPTPLAALEYAQQQHPLRATHALAQALAAAHGGTDPNDPSLPLPVLNTPAGYDPAVAASGRLAAPGALDVASGGPGGPIVLVHPPSGYLLPVASDALKTLPPADSHAAATITFPPVWVEEILWDSLLQDLNNRPAKPTTTTTVPPTHRFFLELHAPLHLHHQLWPADAPLPPLDPLHAGRTRSKITPDTGLVYRVSPAGMKLPPDASARVCVYTGPLGLAASVAAQWALGLKGKRPVLLFADYASDGKTSGGAYPPIGDLDARDQSSMLEYPLHYSPSYTVQEQGGMGQATPLADAVSDPSAPSPLTQTYSWRPPTHTHIPNRDPSSTGYTPLRPVATAVQSLGFTPDTDDQPGGSGRLCADTTVLPALVVVGWMDLPPESTLPVGVADGTVHVAADVNPLSTEVSLPYAYSATPGTPYAVAPGTPVPTVEELRGGSFPLALTAFRETLVFTADSPVLGRQLWSHTPHPAPANSAPGTAPGVGETFGRPPASPSSTRRTLPLGLGPGPAALGTDAHVPLLVPLGMDPLAIPGAGLPTDAAVHGAYAPSAHTRAVRPSLPNYPTPALSFEPEHLCVYGGFLYFSGVSANQGRELWVWAGGDALPGAGQTPLWRHEGVHKVRQESAYAKMGGDGVEAAAAWKRARRLGGDLGNDGVHSASNVVQPAVAANAHTLRRLTSLLSFDSLDSTTTTTASGPRRLQTPFLGTDPVHPSVHLDSPLTAPFPLFDLVPGSGSSTPQDLITHWHYLLFTAISPRTNQREIFLFRDNTVPPPPDIPSGAHPPPTNVQQPPVPLSSLTRNPLPHTVAIGTNLLGTGFKNPHSLTACGPHMGWGPGTSEASPDTKYGPAGVHAGPAYGTPLSAAPGLRVGQTPSVDSLVFFVATPDTTHAGNPPVAPAAGHGVWPPTAPHPDLGEELWVGVFAPDTGEWISGLLADLVPGLGSSSPRHLYCFTGFLYFTAETAATGRELYRQDTVGIASLLLQARDAVRQPPPAETGTFPAPESFTPRAYSLGQPPVTGVVLPYLAALGLIGPLPAPVLVADLAPGVDSAFSATVPPYFAVFQGHLFFAAYSPVTGTELYQLAHPLLPVDAYMRPSRLRPRYPEELYVVDLATGKSSLPLGLGADPTGARYRTFLAEHVPRLVHDFLPGGGGAGTSTDPAFLTPAGLALYFACNTPVQGRELCAYTFEEFGGSNIKIVADIDSFKPAEAPAMGEIAARGLTDPVVGQLNPWLDGNSNPTHLVRLGGDVYFAADNGDGGAGREVFVFVPPPELQYVSKGLGLDNDSERDFLDGRVTAYSEVPAALLPPASTENDLHPLLFHGGYPFLGQQYRVSDTGHRVYNDRLMVRVLNPTATTTIPFAQSVTLFPSRHIWSPKTEGSNGGKTGSSSNPSSHASQKAWDTVYRRADSTWYLFDEEHDLDLGRTAADSYYYAPAHSRNVQRALHLASRALDPLLTHAPGTPLPEHAWYPHSPSSSTPGSNAWHGIGSGRGGVSLDLLAEASEQSWNQGPALYAPGAGADLHAQLRAFETAYGQTIQEGFPDSAPGAFPGVRHFFASEYYAQRYPPWIGAIGRLTQGLPPLPFRVAPRDYLPPGTILIQGPPVPKLLVATANDNGTPTVYLYRALSTIASTTGPDTTVPGTSASGSTTPPPGFALEAILTDPSGVLGSGFGGAVAVGGPAIRPFVAVAAPNAETLVGGQPNGRILIFEYDEDYTPPLAIDPPYPWRLTTALTHPTDPLTFPTPPAASALGHSLQAHHNILVAGDPQCAPYTSGPSAGLATGCVLLWVRPSSPSASWPAPLVLLPDVATTVLPAGAEFGASVALTDGIITVAAPGMDAGAGRVFIFVWDPTKGVWHNPPQAEIVPPATGTTAWDFTTSGTFGRALRMVPGVLFIDAPDASYTSPSIHPITGALLVVAIHPLSGRAVSAGVLPTDAYGLSLPAEFLASLAVSLHAGNALCLHGPSPRQPAATPVATAPATAHGGRSGVLTLCLGSTPDADAAPGTAPGGGSGGGNRFALRRLFGNVPQPGLYLSAPGYTYLPASSTPISLAVSDVEDYAMEEPSMDGWMWDDRAYDAWETNDMWRRSRLLFVAGGDRNGGSTSTAMYIWNDE